MPQADRGRAAVKLERWLLVGVTLAFVITLAVGGRRRAPEATRVDSLRTDVLVDQLQQAGWVVRTAEEDGELQWKLAGLERDTSRLGHELAQLAHHAELAGAQVRAAAELTAAAETSIELPAEVHGDSVRNEPDSVTAPFDDGVFSGRVAYFPAPSSFGLLLRARIDAAVAITEGADGRVMFSAIPRDPRVQLTLDRALYQRPEPVPVCPWGTRARWALGSAAAAAVATTILR